MDAMPFAVTGGAVELTAAGLPLAAADRPAEEPGGEPEVGESMADRPVAGAGSAEAARSLPDFERGGRAVRVIMSRGGDFMGRLVYNASMRRDRPDQISVCEEM